ncbi:MAG: hypothetical protein ACJA1R_000827 [Flavobacteriales bacterium]|jgi:hypothetical protein
MWTGDDRMLLFDDRMPGTRQVSRGLELRIDDATGTVELIWQYVPEGDLFPAIWGDADRLQNANTLLTFGFRSEEASTQTTVVEAAVDNPAWRMRLPTKCGIYRSDRTALLGVQVQLARPELGGRRFFCREPDLASVRAFHYH